MPPAAKSIKEYIMPITKKIFRTKEIATQKADAQTDFIFLENEQIWMSPTGLVLLPDSELKPTHAGFKPANGEYTSDGYDLCLCKVLAFNEIGRLADLSLFSANEPANSNDEESFDSLLELYKNKHNLSNAELTELTEYMNSTYDEYIKATLPLETEIGSICLMAQLNLRETFKAELSNENNTLKAINKYRDDIVSLTKRIHKEVHEIIAEFNEFNAENPALYPRGIPNVNLSSSTIKDVTISTSKKALRITSLFKGRYGYARTDVLLIPFLFLTNKEEYIAARKKHALITVINAASKEKDRIQEEIENLSKKLDNASKTLETATQSLKDEFNISLDNLCATDIKKIKFS